MEQITVGALTGLVSTLLSAGVILVLKNLNKKQKDTSARQEAVEQGMRALLRDRIVQAYYHFHPSGKIAINSLEALEMMHEEYTNLGGNGVVDKLMDDIRQLEVEDI